MNSKFLKVLLLFGLMSLLLCGCSKTDTGEGILHHAQEPTHLTEEVEEGLIIDVEVDSPGGDIPKIYWAQLPQLDETVLNRFFEFIGDATANQIENDVKDGIHVYAANTAKDGYVVFWRSESDRNLPVYALSYSTPIYDTYGFAIRDYYGSDRSVSSGDNTYLYTEPKEFSFCSYEEAKQYAEEVLKTLGIGEPILAESLYLDHEIMGDYVQSEEAYEMLDVYGKTELVEMNWDASLDAYYFHFTVGKDGINAVSTTFSNATFMYAPTDFLLIYNASGLVALTVQSPWCFGAVAEEPDTMIAASTVVEKVKDVETDTLVPFDRLIDQTILQYLYEQNGDRWVLKPVWVVTVLNDDAMPLTNGAAEDTHSCYIFDAISGKEIS